eukprot:sb/3473402/
METEQTMAIHASASTAPHPVQDTTLTTPPRNSTLFVVPATTTTHPVQETSLTTVSKRDTPVATRCHHYRHRDPSPARRHYHLPGDGYSAGGVRHLLFCPLLPTFAHMGKPKSQKTGILWAKWAKSRQNVGKNSKAGGIPGEATRHHTHLNS